MCAYSFRNLVFKGGGIRGVAYAGALLELEDRSLLYPLRRVAGTSAGAITATLVALGYNAREMHEIIFNMDFQKFMDGGHFLPVNIGRLLNTFGWHRGDAFVTWMRELIGKKTGNPDLTFGQLAELAAKDSRFKYLWVVATNLSKQRSDIYSHETTPRMPIVHGVRASMSIPFFFQAPRINGDVMTDGGIAYNYPLPLFDESRYLSRPENGGYVCDAEGKPTDALFNHETLGLRLDDHASYRRTHRSWELKPVAVDNLKEFGTSIASLMMQLVNNEHLVPEDWNRSVFIDTLGVRNTQFDIDNVIKKRLVDSGRYGVKAYFQWRDTDPSWKEVPIA